MDKEYEVTQVTLVALVSLLVEKGVLTAEEYQQRVINLGDAIGLDLGFEKEEADARPNE